MKKILSLFLVTFMFVTNTTAQEIVTTSPAILQTDSKDIVLTYHADQGNKGLAGTTASTPIYAHIGVITDKSKSSRDWRYTKADWAEDIDACKLTYISADTWSLRIGDINTYFGITDKTETVKQIALVFRSATGATPFKEGKTEANGDILIDVHPAGFQMQFFSDAGIVINETSTTANFTIRTTSTAKIELLLNNNVVASNASGMELKHAYTFATKGESYDFVARATSGSNVIEKSLSFLYPTNSVAKNYPGGVPKMGAVANADGTVTFCLAAPGKTNVVLIPSWDNYKALKKNIMNYQDYNGNRYFWTTVSGLDPNKSYPYYYAVDAKDNVGDPYAKLVLDPWSDNWITSDIYPDLIPYPIEHVEGVMLAVYKGNIDKYNWNVTDFKAPAAKDLIIYEMLFRDFTGTEGVDEGNGTVRQAIEKIPYLYSLGVNAVELMPIMEFNGNNSWGYNTNFYFAPDKAYGTHDDYREFIDKCHEAGIAVILDIVFNQSDGLHPWYQMYPIESNPFYNETAPHVYSVLNDWNQDNALVQQQWKDVLQYWLKEFKVDGFRFDLVKGLGNNSSYGGDTEKYNQSRVDRMKLLHSYIKEINPNAYHINENLAGASEENAMAADGQMNWANVNYASCQFAMGFQSGADNNRFLSTNDSRTWGSTISYAESHDEERVAYKQKTSGSGVVKTLKMVQMRRLGSMAAQMILAPGAHMIWQFGEIGADQTTKKGNDNDTDPKIVNWNYLNDADRKGLHQSYTDLCWLRKSNPDLFTQNASFTMNCNSNSWANGRTIRLVNGNQELICVINPNITGAAKAISVTFGSSSNNDYQILSKSYNTTPTFDAATGTVSVPPSAYVVIGNKNISGVEEIAGDITKNTVNVYGGFSEIIINGEYENVAVYSISGQQYSSLNVPAGLYIVNVDGNISKVIVK